MQQTFVIPYIRVTPMQDVRRDLVMHSAESLYLRMTVIERDDPCAQMLLVTSGLGGPAAQLVIWADYDSVCSRCDYGRPPLRGATLWTGWATPQVGLGSFDWHIPAGTLGNLPPRCGWTAMLVWDGGRRVDAMWQGILDVRGRALYASIPEDAGLVLATSDGVPLITSGDNYITT